MDTRLRMGLDPGVGSRLEYEYSVTHSPPGGYCYVNVSEGGPILRAELRRKEKCGNTRVAPKVTTFVFPNFPILLVP